MAVPGLTPRLPSTMVVVTVLVTVVPARTAQLVSVPSGGLVAVNGRLGVRVRVAVVVLAVWVEVLVGLAVGLLVDVVVALEVCGGVVARLGILSVGFPDDVRIGLAVGLLVAVVEGLMVWVGAEVFAVAVPVEVSSGLDVGRRGDLVEVRVGVRVGLLVGVIVDIAVGAGMAAGAPVGSALTAKTSASAVISCPRRLGRYPRLSPNSITTFFPVFAFSAMTVWNDLSFGRSDLRHR